MAMTKKAKKNSACSTQHKCARFMNQVLKSTAFYFECEKPNSFERNRNHWKRPNGEHASTMLLYTVSLP